MTYKLIELKRVAFAPHFSKNKIKRAEEEREKQDWRSWGLIVDKTFFHTRKKAKKKEEKRREEKRKEEFFLKQKFLLKKKRFLSENFEKRKKRLKNWFVKALFDLLTKNVFLNLYLDFVFKGKVFIILLCVNEIKWGNREN